MVQKVKFLCVTLVVVLTACNLTACAGTEETNYTSELMGQAYDAVGFPDISNYFERQQLKEIYELRDDPNLICYWYTVNNMTGKWVYQGKCIGYGIPYTTSMTGSESMQRSGLAGDWEVLPQAEPNGLYASPQTSATWILSVDEYGNITPIYVESEITVTQTKLAAERCEDWSLVGDYSKLPDTAEIEEEVQTAE